jgi:predicted metal-binding protein
MTTRFKKNIDNYFDHSKTIPAPSVPFDNALREMCEQNTCGKLGQSWTCPPAVGPIEELRKKVSGFNHFIIFYKVYKLDGSFDWEGMMDSVKDFQSRISKAQKKIKKETTNFLILGAGACQVCESCTYLEQKPCRFPESALIPVEAFGIDAMKMMIDNGLKYNNGANTVTYIGGLFYP